MVIIKLIIYQFFLQKKKTINDQCLDKEGQKLQLSAVRYQTVR